MRLGPPSNSRPTGNIQYVIYFWMEFRFNWSKSFTLNSNFIELQIWLNSDSWTNLRIFLCCWHNLLQNEVNILGGGALGGGEVESCDIQFQKIKFPWDFLFFFFFLAKFAPRHVLVLCARLILAWYIAV